MGLMPPELEIQWETGKVDWATERAVAITVPGMTRPAQRWVVAGNHVVFDKRIGVKIPLIPGLVDPFLPIFEVIGIDGDLVTVAMGLPAVAGN